MANVRRSIYFSYIGKYAGVFVNVISVTILSRLLTPEETGLYSVAAALINIAHVFRSFGSYGYILQEKDLSYAKLRTASGISAGMGVVLFLVFLLLSQPIADFYGNEGLAYITNVLSFNFILVGFASIGSARLARAMNFGALVAISFVSTAMNALVSILLAVAHFGPVCLAWGSLAGVGAVLLGNVLVLGRGALVPPGFQHWRSLTQFGLFSSGSGILLAIAERTPDLVIGRVVGLAGAGLFSRGNGLVRMADDLILGALRPVMASSFAQINRESDGKLRDHFLQNLSSVCVVAWPVLAVLGLLAHPIIQILFGDKWLASVPVAQALFGAAMLGLVGNVARILLSGIGAVRPNFFLQAVSVPLYISAFVIGARHGLVYAAFGGVVSGAIMTGLSLLVLRKKLAFGFRALARAVWPGLASAALSVSPVVVALYTFAPLSWPLWLETGIEGICATFGWLVSLYILRHSLRHEIESVARLLWMRGFPRRIAR